MAQLFQTQWAICPNGFEFWAEPWYSFLAHPPLLFPQWLCGKAASGLERTSYGELVKSTLGKHGQVHWPLGYN